MRLWSTLLPFDSAPAVAHATPQGTLALPMPRARLWPPLAEPRCLWDYRRSGARERRSTEIPSSARPLVT